MPTDETPDWARARLLEYKRVSGGRDQRVVAARRLGLTKSEIHELSGIARTTINRILGARDEGE